MALSGTLKDFGIADIFQLIGQQQKTGVLHLTDRDEEVHVAIGRGLCPRLRAEEDDPRGVERGAYLLRQPLKVLRVYGTAWQHHGLRLPLYQKT